MYSEWHVLEGTHSFICNLHVYPQTEQTIMHLRRKHSPDGAAWAR